jgi:ribosomal protein S18 acetylase RimI-like enzyme
MIKPTPYSSLDDIEAAKQVLLAGRKASRHSGYIHPGDLDWWLVSLRRDHDLGDLLFVWREGGKVIGWSLLSPAYSAFDVYILPHLRASTQHGEMIDWTEAHLLDLLHEEHPEKLRVMWVWEDDEDFQTMLAYRNFAPSGDGMRYMVQPLAGKLPSPSLPPGYSIRPMRGEADLPARVEAHRGAFDPSRMTEETYRTVIGSGQYDARADMIVTAPDGRVASFALGWLDRENCIGAFEPVGTHPEFQRQGLGKAAILGGLNQMQALGMTESIVYVEERNPAGIALYASAGFRTAKRILDYVKQV